MRKRTTDSRCSSIRTKYRHKTEKLDFKFAPEAMPLPGAGPFSKALQSFVAGGIQPVVVGAFGEFNEEALSLVKYCAVKAANTQTGLGLSPFV
eukprot:CAMPEP_0194331682 /NCGR_PEP_ID=MMETSP0171-20130528/56437_1 /TAXON_ID=218684 /ORGANISM="Corethron pennatum, Strain L29A3" /LENGTH=92 /DNA_ID=CAMNT_0039093239 /DNA_START=21 /DNA_END=295 /DNA_ORIENTATION=+